jgi:hypothetical protein
VTAAKLATDAVTQPKLADDAVGAAELENNAVDTNALQIDSVDNLAIQNDAVDADKLAAGAVGAAAFKLNTTISVDWPSIAQGACTSQNLSVPGTLASDMVLVNPGNFPGGWSLYATTAAGQVQLTACAISGATPDPPPLNHEIVLIG